MSLGTWGEDFLKALEASVDRRIEALIGQRIRRIEQQIASAQPLATSTSRCVVTEAHIEKLERIREAAAEVTAAMDDGKIGYAWESKEILALMSAVKRS